MNFHSFLYTLFVYFGLIRVVTNTQLLSQPNNQIQQQTEVSIPEGFSLLTLRLICLAKQSFKTLGETTFNAASKSLINTAQELSISFQHATKNSDSCVNEPMLGYTILSLGNENFHPSIYFMSLEAFKKLNRTSALPLKDVVNQYFHSQNINRDELLFLLICGKATNAQERDFTRDLSETVNYKLEDALKKIYETIWSDLLKTEEIETLCAKVLSPDSNSKKEDLHESVRGVIRKRYLVELNSPNEEGIIPMRSIWERAKNFGTLVARRKGGNQLKKREEDSKDLEASVIKNPVIKANPRLYSDDEKIYQEPVNPRTPLFAAFKPASHRQGSQFVNLGYDRDLTALKSQKRISSSSLSNEEQKMKNGISIRPNLQRKQIGSRASTPSELAEEPIEKNMYWDTHGVPFSDVPESRPNINHNSLASSPIERSTGNRFIWDSRENLLSSTQAAQSDSDHEIIQNNYDSLLKKYGNSVNDYHSIASSNIDTSSLGSVESLVWRNAESPSDLSQASQEFNPQYYRIASVEIENPNKKITSQSVSNDASFPEGIDTIDIPSAPETKRNKADTFPIPQRKPFSLDAPLSSAYRDERDRFMAEFESKDQPEPVMQSRLSTPRTQKDDKLDQASGSEFQPFQGVKKLSQMYEAKEKSDFPVTKRRCIDKKRCFQNRPATPGGVPYSTPSVSENEKCYFISKPSKVDQATNTDHTLLSSPKIIKSIIEKNSKGSENHQNSNGIVNQKTNRVLPCHDLSNDYKKQNGHIRGQQKPVKGILKKNLSEVVSTHVFI